MAAPATEIRVEGVETLRATLKRAMAEIDTLEDGHRKVAAIVNEEAQRRVPRRTGRLASSMKPTRSKKRASVTARVPYSKPIHWGWPARGIPANEYLYGAAKDTEAEWLRAYDREIQAALNKVRGA